MASRSTKTTKNDQLTSKSDRCARQDLRDAGATEGDFGLTDGLFLPDLQALFPGRHIEVETGDEETLAFDTSAHALARAGVSLTRHSDPQPGWQLTAPDADVHLTSGARARTVPVALASAVAGVRRGADLVQTGSVTVETRTLTITHPAVTSATPNSDPLTVIDTTTRVITGGDEGRLSTIRRVTFSGDDASVGVIRAALLGAGAVPWTQAPADVRILLRASSPEPKAVLGAVPQTLGELVGQYLNSQFDAIVRGDLVLRSGRPSVHRTRVAVRRTRSTLRTFASVVDAEAAAALGTELGWYAKLLGEVRDREVLHDRLAGQISALDEGDLLGSVASHVESTLASERGEHLRTVIRTLDSERYTALLTSIEEWRTATPFTEHATRPAAKAQKVLRKAEHTLDRRLADVLVGVTDLHPARKAAKRLRYAAELSEPVLGKVARKTVKRNTALQTMLGEHQDSVVSAGFLRRLGASAGISEGHNGYTYGLLAAHEQHRAVRIRDQVLRSLGG